VLTDFVSSEKIDNECDAMYMVQMYQHSCKMSINFHQTQWHHILQHNIKTQTEKRLISSHVTNKEIRHSLMAAAGGGMNANFWSTSTQMDVHSVLRTSYRPPEHAKERGVSLVLSD
jgi:glutaminase